MEQAARLPRPAPRTHSRPSAQDPRCTTMAMKCLLLHVQLSEVFVFFLYSHSCSGAVELSGVMLRVVTFQGDVRECHSCMRLHRVLQCSLHEEASAATSQASPKHS
mmetsp:Transcript_50744/g.127891  ORF Transcript_50744/g.127891 Transcript_50744/m.127891 type:complete len:106 (+) Transcript_50744:1137-1454(+)